MPKKKQAPIYLVVECMDYEGPCAFTMFHSKRAAEEACGAGMLMIGPLKPRKRTSFYD